MTTPTPARPTVAGLSADEREALLAPCVCGHTINDHGSLEACWLCGEEGDHCATNFEDLLCARVDGIVTARVRALLTDAGGGPA